jgi:glycosyltransferase involved in cell wall biosynthesis
LRILVLTKRQYMGKDLVEDRFGRFRELPLELARLGHTVRGLALSYRPATDGIFVDEVNSPAATVTWHCINLLSGRLPRLRKYINYALQTAREFQPELIWACSDAYHVIFGKWLAKRVGARCVIDLYDNFEAFGASRLPGVLPLFRRAVRSADGVSVFSRRLADYVGIAYRRTKATSVIENGIREDLFYPRDRIQCRQEMGLPVDAVIIGTAGALDTSRGIEALFEAFAILASETKELHLALAGPRQDALRVPQGPRVHDFGELPHAKVPVFLNALDLAVICYRRSAQGEVSFPQKTYEIFACRLPLVAAAIGSMNELLKDCPACLYEPEDPQNLAAAIRRQLEARTIMQTPAPSWADSASILSEFFAEVAGERGSGGTLEA